MNRRMLLGTLALAVVATLVCNSLSFAGFPKVKVKSLGKYQQQAAAKGFGAVVGTGAGIAATPYAGPYGGAAIGAGVSHGVGNHAAKKWTGKGLNNWNKPGRW